MERARAVFMSYFAYTFIAVGVGGRKQKHELARYSLTGMPSVHATTGVRVGAGSNRPSM